MTALQIRGVPDDVRDVLADRASAKGQSLQSYLLALVTEEARRAANLAVLERFADRDDGTTVSGDDVVDTIHEARAERDAHLARVVGGAAEGD